MGAANPLHAQPRAGPCAASGKNQGLIARWEILRVLLGTEGNGRPWHGPVWLLRDGTPRWLLGGGWSLTHPSTGIIPPFQLVLTAHTRTPARHRSGHSGFVFGSKRAAQHACSAGHWRGTKLFKAHWAPWQYPALRTGPGSCSSIPAVKHSQDISP